jgi:hypothetical protein
MLRSEATLALVTNDAYRARARRGPAPDWIGNTAYPGPCSIAAAPRCPELAAYHGDLGLGPRRVLSPVAGPGDSGARLAERLLDDADLCRRIRSDSGLQRIFVSFKDETTARLVEHLGLEPVYCAPAAKAYEAANDKLDFARAGPVYGFEAVPVEPVADLSALEAAFRRQSRRWEVGCIVRLRHGSGGDHIEHASSVEDARRAWQRLRARGEVLVAPYVPRQIVTRNVAVHGLVSPTGFSPLLYSDQRTRKGRFIGGTVTRAWDVAEIEPISRALVAIARWLRELGYLGAPAGVDGFLVREERQLRFLAVDPNARLTATMLPWSLASVLSERAGRRLDWEFQRFACARELDLDVLRRRLGMDLLDPAAPHNGGILPTFPATRAAGRAAWTLPAMLLGHDAQHVAHLRSRLRELARDGH